MYSRILIAYDGSPDGNVAIERAAEFVKVAATHDTQPKIAVLAVMYLSAGVLAAISQGATEVLDASEAEMREILATGIGMLRQRGIAAEADFTTGEPAREICEAAKRMDADLIVLGHRSRRTLARFWEGSVGSRVLEAAPCSVLVAVGD